MEQKRNFTKDSEEVAQLNDRKDWSLTIISSCSVSMGGKSKEID